MRPLGGTAIGAQHRVLGLEGHVRTALALAGLGGTKWGIHEAILVVFACPLQRDGQANEKV